MANGPYKFEILKALDKLRKYKKKAVGVRRRRAQDLIKRIHELLERFQDERHTNKPLFMQKYNRILEETKKLLEE